MLLSITTGFSLLLSLPHKAPEVAGIGLINSSPKIACLGDSTEGGHCSISLDLFSFWKD
jgi:hypothetical protein